MRKKKDTHSFDFRPLGLAIREAREKAGLSRNDLGDKVFYGERHIADIENVGKHPSFQLFHDLVTMFNISVLHITSKEHTIAKLADTSQAHTEIEVVPYPVREILCVWSLAGNDKEIARLSAKHDDFL